MNNKLSEEELVERIKNKSILIDRINYRFEEEKNKYDVKNYNYKLAVDCVLFQTFLMFIASVIGYIFKMPTLLLLGFAAFRLLFIMSIMTIIVVNIDSKKRKKCFDNRVMKIKRVKTKVKMLLNEYENELNRIKNNNMTDNYYVPYNEMNNTKNSNLGKIRVLKKD